MVQFCWNNTKNQVGKFLPAFFVPLLPDSHGSDIYNKIVDFVVWSHGSFIFSGFPYLDDTSSLALTF